MLCNIPAYFEEEALGGKCIMQFTSNKMLAEKLIGFLPLLYQFTNATFDKK